MDERVRWGILGWDSDLLVGAVPLRITTPADRPAAPAVIFLHGLSATKETHASEARSLAAAGLAAALPDAPHHGARRGPLLDAMAAATSDDEAHALFLRLVEEAAAEVPAIVDALLARGHPRVAIAGISLGGFTALAAATIEPRLAAVVSILGSPDWTPRSGKVSPELEAVVGRAPMHRLASFPPRPVALLNAGRDGTVPPAPARRFADALRPLYASAPDDLLHREYPESDHMMREDEWRDLWTTTVAFLRRALPQ